MTHQLSLLQKMIFLSGIFFICLSPVTAQSYPQWGGLEPGPYQVGFRVVQTEDQSRTYQSHAAPPNQQVKAVTARPMQLSIWYPAAALPAASRAPYSEYSKLWSLDLGQAADPNLQQAYHAHGLRQSLTFGLWSLGEPRDKSISDEAYARIMATPTAVTWNAPPLPGSFPVMIFAFAGGTIGTMSYNIWLEYWASHGYIVITMPHLGTSPIKYRMPDWSAAEIAAAAQDIGFIVDYASKLPGADARTVGVIGFMSLGGLLYQMQTNRLGALALFDEGDFSAELRKLPGFNLDLVRIPLLNIPSTQAPPHAALLEQMKYAERTTLMMKDADHGFFSQFIYPDRTKDQTGLEMAIRYTRRFFDAHLKGDTAGRAFLTRQPEENGAPAGLVKLSRMPAKPAVPTADEFLTLIVNNQLAEAKRIYFEVKAREPERRLFSEERINYLLRQLGQERGFNSLMIVFELVADAFPNSMMSRNSYGNALMQAGDTAGALREFEAALELLSKDTTLSPEQRAAQEKAWREKITRLRSAKEQK